MGEELQMCETFWNRDHETPGRAIRRKAAEWGASVRYRGSISHYMLVSAERPWTHFLSTAAPPKERNKTRSTMPSTEQPLGSLCSLVGSIDEIKHIHARAVIWTITDFLETNSTCNITLLYSKKETLKVPATSSLFLNMTNGKRTACQSYIWASLAVTFYTRIWNG